MYIFFTLYLLYHLLFPLKTYFCACAIYTIYNISFLPPYPLNHSPPKCSLHTPFFLSSKYINTRASVMSKHTSTARSSFYRAVFFLHFFFHFFFNVSR